MSQSIPKLISPVTVHTITNQWVHAGKEVKGRNSHCQLLDSDPAPGE